MIAEDRVKLHKALDKVIKSKNQKTKLNNSILYLESVLIELKYRQVDQVEKDRMLLYKIAKILGIK